MAEILRPIARRFPGIETLEGAGVRLRRSFGQRDVPLLDPFLLLDHFGSENPADYMAGFPWHPHRGIETVTYMLEGRVAHGDTLGNEGVIDPGAIQWMRAGSGIIHQEMPERSEGRLDGFQLWVNLPAREKMSTPRYLGITPGEIPRVELPSGARARVVAGRFGGVEGPVQGLAVDPTYVDL
ncbi:Pirin, partial [mine drainage metagenome]